MLPSNRWRCKQISFIVMPSSVQNTNVCYLFAPCQGVLQGGMRTLIVPHLRGRMKAIMFSSLFCFPLYLSVCLLSINRSIKGSIRPRGVLYRPPLYASPGSYSCQVSTRSPLSLRLIPASRFGDIPMASSTQGCPLLTELAERGWPLRGVSVALVAGVAADEWCW